MNEPIRVRPNYEDDTVTFEVDTPDGTHSIKASRYNARLLAGQINGLVDHLRARSDMDFTWLE